MDTAGVQIDSPMFDASKAGVDIRLARDPRPGIHDYVVIETPDFLVLFPKNQDLSKLPKLLPHFTSLRLL
jgi:hypothetical protein